MKKRIFVSILCASAATIVLCLFLIMGVLYDYFGSVQRSQLSEECRLAAQGVERDGIGFFDGFTSDSMRITLVSQDGTVLYDNVAEAATMENHLNREEIAEAIQHGVGESERYSDTVLEETLYSARRLSDGSVIRTAVTRYSIIALLLGTIQPIIFIAIIVLILSVAFSGFVSNKIIRPLNSLNLDEPLKNETYDEISPLLNRIEGLKRRLDEEKQELTRKREEFYLVTEGMNEGLVLLSPSNTVVVINRAAMELFDTDAECIGKNMLTVCRLGEIRKLISPDNEDENDDTIVEISGKIYRFTATPIKHNDEIAGRCLLAFDVTEKTQAERIRREFTSNVSHELKTPLHSIMGMAELMENGLMAQEDVPHFVGRIRQESARLVSLIDDIIRLSQLDGENALPTETVDLHELAAEAVEAISDEAKKKNVTLSVSGEKAEINGVRPLLYEIIYNLADNAVRYNRDGGSATVFVGTENNDTIVRVTDTGIGIPVEHQARIFERFYRVDKSHSRSCGGTGLGLSIVKHAAEYHHAKIELKSKTDTGTEITVRFSQ